MEKKRSTFFYLAVHDLIGQALLLIVEIVIFIALYWKLREAATVIFNHIFIMFSVIIGGSFLYSSLRYEEFQMFHFTRKRFYRYQIILGIMRAAELALCRTIYQIVLREDFIKYYVEDTEISVESFLQNPAGWELFLTNLCMFAIIDQIQLICNTWIYDFYAIRDFGEGTSPQKRLRIALNKEKHPGSWKWAKFGKELADFVFLVVVASLFYVYAALQLQLVFGIRMLVLIMLIIFWFVLLFVGKRRYIPQYI